MRNGEIREVFMKPQNISVNHAPGEAYQLKYRFWQGCPSILRTPGGRLFAAWYSGGTGEPSEENYNLLIRSNDDGWTWQKPELVIPSEPDSGFLVIDIQLWLDPLNRMWLFVVQRRIGGERLQSDPDHLATWALVCDDPDAEKLRWSEPRIVSQGFLRNQPVALSNGDWVMCAYDWSSPNYRYSRSSDQGETWIRCEAGRKMGIVFEETMILERKDHTLLLFARDNNPLLVRSIGADPAGSSWTPGEYLPVLNANSRFFLRRLKSGRILLIHNNAVTHRTNLCARLSEDEGETWKYSLLLDTAPTPEQNVSYPDAVQADDGRIFIIYDCGRTTFKEIRMAQITEEDIIRGSLVDYDSYLARIISKAPGKPYDPVLYEQKKSRRDIWFKTVFLRLVRDQLDKKAETEKQNMLKVLTF